MAAENLTREGLAQFMLVRLTPTIPAGGAPAELKAAQLHLLAEVLALIDDPKGFLSRNAKAPTG